MNKNLSIKYSINKNTLSDKLLQNIPIHTISGTIITKTSFEDLFEVDINAKIVNSSSIIFKDMNLNIFNCQFNFNIIGIDNINKGIFFKSDYNFTINHKSFNSINAYNLLILDSYFHKTFDSNIDFSIVVALDLSINSTVNIPIINPNTDNNINHRNHEINLFFDKEFI